jgi:hypothetical protein
MHTKNFHPTSTVTLFEEIPLEILQKFFRKPSEIYYRHSEIAFFSLVWEKFPFGGFFTKHSVGLHQEGWIS